MPESCYLGNNRAVVQLYTGQKMIVDTLNRDISPHILIDGYWAKHIDIVLERYLEPETRVLDLGCHMGYTSIMMGGDGRTVTAVDANKSYKDLVVENLALNGIEGDVENFAVGLTSGSIYLETNDSYSGGNYVTADRGSTIVPLENISNYIGFDLVKIDLEGLDGWIAGALARSSEPPRIIIMEWRVDDIDRHWDQFYTAGVDLKDEVVYLDSTYTVSIIQPDGTEKLTSLVEIEKDSSYEHIDLVLVRK